MTDEASPDQASPDQAPTAQAPTGHAPRWTVLAHLLRPQGRKGEVLAELLTDFPERFDSREHLYLVPEDFGGTSTQARPVEVSSFFLPVGRNAGRIVLALKGIDTIEAAESVAGLEIVIEEADRLPLEEDAIYISDLVGCSVFDVAAPDEASREAGEVLVGTVTDVQFALTADGGRRLEDAAPLLEVLGVDGDEVLIPYVKAYLVAHDPVAKTLKMSLPAGLIEINRA